MRERSPDLWRDRRDEVAHRLDYHASRMPAHVDLVIDNHGAREAHAKIEILRVVDTLLERSVRAAI
jgi:hypothetical protein